MTAADLKAAYREPFPGATYEWFTECSVPQSLMFAADLLPTFNRMMRLYPYGTKIKMLDAGTSSGAGADLWGRVYKSSFNRCSLDIDAVELFDTYENFARAAFPNINYIVGDAFDLVKRKQYDWITASHVIEHFTDPTDFITSLQSAANDFLILYAPLNEKQRLDGHLTTITEKYLRRFDPISLSVVHSAAWQHPHDEISECVIAVLPGKRGRSLIPKPTRWRCVLHCLGFAAL